MTQGARSDAVQARPLRRLPAFLTRALTRCGVRFVRLFLLETDIEGEPPAVEPGLALEVRRAGPAEIEQARAQSSQHEDHRLAQELDAGARCYVALHEGVVAGFTMIDTARIQLMEGVELAPPPEGVAYSFHSHVFERYRGKRVFQTLLSGVGALLRREGIRQLVNVVDRDNAVSIRARRKLGARGRPVALLVLPWMRPRLLGARLSSGERIDS